MAENKIPTTLASKMTSATMTTGRLNNTRMLQNFHLVWLDESVDANNSDNDRDAIKKLRQLVNNVSVFNDTDECIEFVTDKEELAFVIVSEDFSQNVMPILQDISQVSEVYIYCKNDKCQGKRVQQIPKMKGVHTDIVSICETLGRAIRVYDRNSVSIGFVRSSYMCTKENLNELDSSFMYTQILKKILLTIDFEQEHIDDFLKYCKENLAHDNAQLKIIDKIEQEYRDHQPIWWYTYPCFLHSMLNRALRTMEVDLIIKLGFFIRDLYIYIAERHAEQYGGHSNPDSFIVYRGQGLSQVNFEQLKNTLGGLISFNNFLSTSIDEAVSYAYAESNLDTPDFIGVHFKITINPSISSSSFANVKNDSYFQEEEEILFSPHSVFRVRQVTQNEENNRLWQVELVLTSDDDPQLHALTECILEETYGITGWHRLGKLLLNLGEYSKAKELHEILLQNVTNMHEKADTLNSLGRIAEQQGQYPEAIINYQKSLEIHEKILPSNHSVLATAYSNIGLVYNSMGEYPQALSYCKKGLEIEQKCFPAIDKNLAQSYNNIGLVLNNMGEYSKAIRFYEKDLEITKETLPLNHPYLATSYNNIAMVYHNIGEYSKALEYYEKAVEIFLKTLPPNHPDLGTIYNNIGAVHSKMNEYSKALHFHEKALEMKQRTLHPNHPSLATSYKHIGFLYTKKGEYSKALMYYENMLEIEKANLPSNHPNLGISYMNIAMVYSEMGEYLKALPYSENAFEIFQKNPSSYCRDLFVSCNNITTIYNNMHEYPKALFYYEKTLEIIQQFFPENRLELATCYNNIGATYESMGKYSDALSYLEKAIEIEQKTLPVDHPDLGNAYNNIATVYKKMEEYSKALPYYEKALEIKQKTLPTDDLNLALLYNDIAKVYSRVEKYSKALSCFECCLSIVQRVLSENHPVIETIKINIESVKNCK